VSVASSQSRHCVEPPLKHTSCQFYIVVPGHQRASCSKALRLRRHHGCTDVDPATVTHATCGCVVHPAQRACSSPGLTRKVEVGVQVLHHLCCMQHPRSGTIKTINSTTCSQDHSRIWYQSRQRGLQASLASRVHPGSAGSPDSRV
jgi:hypothetical protein